jgi:hypothetical protein
MATSEEPGARSGKRKPKLQLHGPRCGPSPAAHPGLVLQPNFTSYGTFDGKEKIGAAYVTVIVRAEVAAVKAAIEAGQRAAAPLGKVIAAHVIAQPHEDLRAASHLAHES